MAKAEVVAVEVDNRHNRSWLFPPLDRRVRGRYRFDRVPEPLAMLQARRWPSDGVPGQVLELDPASGTAAVVEPLRQPEHRAVREQLERDGLSVGPEREEFRGVHVPTWVHYLRRGLEAGIVRLVRGRLPEVEGEPKSLYRWRPPTEERREMDAMRAELAELRAAVRELRRRER